MVLYLPKVDMAIHWKWHSKPAPYFGQPRYQHGRDESTGPFPLRLQAPPLQRLWGVRLGGAAVEGLTWCDFGARRRRRRFSDGLRRSEVGAERREVGSFVVPGGLAVLFEVKSGTQLMWEKNSQRQTKAPFHFTRSKEGKKIKKTKLCFFINQSWSVVP